MNDNEKLVDLINRINSLKPMRKDKPLKQKKDSVYKRQIRIIRSK